MFGGSRSKFQSFGRYNNNNNNNNNNCIYLAARSGWDGTVGVLCEPAIIARVYAFSSLTIPVLMGLQTFAHEDQIEYLADVITPCVRARAAPSSSRVSLIACANRGTCCSALSYRDNFGCPCGLFFYRAAADRAAESSRFSSSK